MREFSTTVDLRSRKAMTHYLQSHFRYYTMNSWNGVDSYACNMKLYKLGLPYDVADKMYDLLCFQEFFDLQKELMDDFAVAHNYRWQVGMNGRSGGYLVLYEGQLRPSQYKSFCTSCGNRHYTAAKCCGKVCGNCGKNTIIDYLRPPMEAICFPGRGVDTGEDYSDWTISDLRDRVRLVQELDALADAMVTCAIDFARSYKIVEEEILCSQTQHILVPIT